MKKLPKRPILITIGMIVACMNAFIVFIVTPVILITQKTIISNGQRMTTGYFAIHEFPIILIYGSLNGIIFWTFMKGIRWSRHIVIAFWIFMLALTFIDLQPEERSGLMIMIGSFLAISGYYFYLKPKVVAYYKELPKTSAK